MTEQELRDWIQLTATPGLGNAAIRRLLARFGLPARILAQSSALLESCISNAQARTLLCPSDSLRALQETTWQWLQTNTVPLRHHIVALGDPDYPSRLLETADPPVLLYVAGHERWFDEQGRLLAWPDRALAVVGSRNPTAQGCRTTQDFTQALTAQGITVVSGLALGIDAAAHSGALSVTDHADFPTTLAVIGTGIDRVYPKQHHSLAKHVAEQGWIISEYHLGTPPLAQNFPKRNRLLSGLTLGTLVVEAAPQSGSLVTARLASEQGREVFAIPGSIHSPQSKGCHALIRQGAKLVESVADIAEELPQLAPSLKAMAKPRSASPASPDTVRDDPLLHALGFDPVDLDTLSERTGMDIANLQIQLLERELQGQVARLPGGLYQRLVSS